MYCVYRFRGKGWLSYIDAHEHIVELFTSSVMLASNLTLLWYILSRHQLWTCLAFAGLLQRTPGASWSVRIGRHGRRTWHSPWYTRVQARENEQMKFLSRIWNIHKPWCHRAKMPMSRLTPCASLRHFPRRNDRNLSILAYWCKWTDISIDI